MSQKANSNVFLVVWDCEGLEYIEDLTEHERGHTWAALTDDHTYGVDFSRRMNGILMRARVNNQRHYEIYTVQTTTDITVEDLRQMFNDNPQTAADLIRERGNSIYSDRRTSKYAIV